MKLREPVACAVDLALGSLSRQTGRYVKTFADLASVYADDSAYAEMLAGSGERVVYEVSEFRPSNSAHDMIFGVTRLVPGKVGREFFMTRGHLHARANRPEIYYGQSGSGLMLMESPDGETRTVVIETQTVCYVPPFWIHRSVNTGQQDLVMMFCYPADSGQDYAIIERAGGMRQLIVDDGAGGWTAIDNPRYRRRSAHESASIFQSAP